jgi:hypothetical protein
MATRPSTKAARYAAASAGRFAENALTRLGRWATTDHTGTAKMLANLPPMGWMDTLSFVLIHILFSILGAVASGFMVYALIAYGIPLLLGA